MTLPTLLPRKVTRRAVQPPGLPAGELAWSRDDALLVLAALEGTIVAILQIDAYVVPYGQPVVIPTGRRAIYVYLPGERAAEFARRSRQLAADFVRAGSPDELFALVFSGQDDAEEGHGTAWIKVG
jgi:hypothetical protein